MSRGPRVVVIYATQMDVCEAMYSWQKLDVGLRKLKVSRNRVNEAKRLAAENPNSYVCFSWRPKDACWAHCEYVRECEAAHEDKPDAPDGSVVLVQEK